MIDRYLVDNVTLSRMTANQRASAFMHDAQARKVRPPVILKFERDGVEKGVCPGRHDGGLGVVASHVLNVPGHCGFGKFFLNLG